ncbi:MAG: response regulator transcription factor [Lewinellaceae bacterium]|nr:response regulator transcription factor [Saprospiraceae bacterium]MCB9341666.1 response regulator transcription factor [Lewinellaceae bacterium]
MKTLSTIKLMVLDNEPAQLEILEFFLRRIGVGNIRTANSYRSAVELFREYKPDVALLDIELGEERSGLDVARYIKSESNTPFLFITSNYTSKMYEQAKELGPRAFIGREMNELSLRQAIELATGHLDGDASQEGKAGSGEDFYVKFGSQLKKIHLADILWVEVDGRYSLIKTADGKKTLVNTPLRETVLKLPQDRFVRVHKSFVVNLDKVSSVDIGNDIAIVAGEEIPIGRNFKKAFSNRMRLF